MPDINQTILDLTKRRLNRYNLSISGINRFLAFRGDFDSRQGEAIRITSDIMNVHGKNDLIYTVIELARVEQGIRELEPWARDHVVHALLSFLLGIYINENFLRPLSSIFVDGFQWKLAGLFHDVGYPMEMAMEYLARPFTDTINRSKQKIGVSAPNVGCRITPYGLENLQNEVNGFELIQKRLDMWGLHVDAKRAYDKYSESGRICHGMISSLAVLYLIDLLYQKFNRKREYKDIYIRRHPRRGDINFNQIYFERDVVSACAAIYIHNLPAEYFAEAKIDRLKTPIAFLLKLADSLQEWERPSKKNPTGFSASSFNIRIEGKQLLFNADVPDHVKEKMKNAISSTLCAQDIAIE